MRIIVVNVNTSQTMTAVIEQAARRYASAETQITALRPYFGPEAVDCNFESYLSAVAVMIGRAYSVVTTLQRSVPAIEDRLRLAGVWDRCASVRASGMSTLDVDNDPAAAVRAVVAEAAVAVETDRAEVICLGCAGMAGLEEAITTELHVPVVDGVGAAVRLAEALVGLGLKTSKLSTYALPEPKKITGWPLSSALGLRHCPAGRRERHHGRPDGPGLAVAGR